MELIIGCIFLTVLLLILLIFCRNVNINVNITHSQPLYEKLSDNYNVDGEPKDNNNEYTIDDIIKTVNDIMLDREDED